METTTSIRRADPFPTTGLQAPYDEYGPRMVSPYEIGARSTARFEGLDVVAWVFAAIMILGPLAAGAFRGHAG